MKKHFILLSAFAVWMLSAMMLTACGYDVQTVEGVGTESLISTETASTIFLSGDDGTRTSMDTNLKFYWSEGDQIYVNTEGENYQKTYRSTLYENNRKADFVLNGVQMTAPKCSVMYIGNGTTAATATASDLKVKIEAIQTQSQWGNSAHLGASGDCGVDEATKGIDEKYSFTLKHKAAYLIFQPYQAIKNVNPDWRLMKIEIIANGTTLAGEYSFGTGELNVSGATNTTGAVTLNCGTDGFAMGNSAALAANSCFAVIQPGSHELTIRYTVEVTGKENVLLFTPSGGELGTMSFEKKIAARSYNANSVTAIKHELFLPPDYLYQWNATDTYLNTWQTYVFDLAVIAPTQLTSSLWGELPNVNELYSYVAYSDPRWDKQTLWSIDGGLTVYTGGCWLKKRSVIGSQFSDAVGMNGIDMRSSPTEMAYKVDTYTYRFGGKPDDSVIDQYFFLPTIGDYFLGERRHIGNLGVYWSRSAFITGDSAYSLYISSSSVIVHKTGRHFGNPLTPDWFK